MHGFVTYDESCDIVGALEWLLTGNTDIAPTVAHFERFPKISTLVDNSAKDLRPDFTVLFKDGAALIGEISRLARHPNSVRDLACQISNYGWIKEVPADGCGKKASPKALGILLLMPMEVANQGVTRLLGNPPEHGEQFPVKPCVTQYVRSDTQKLLYQYVSLPENGLLPVTGHPNLDDFIRQPLAIKSEMFADVRAARPFVNDEVDGLYLAVHLLTRTWPTMYPEYLPGDVVVDLDRTWQQLKDEGAHIRKKDIKRALGLLKDAGVARQESKDWIVAIKPMRTRKHGRQMEKILAERAGQKRAFRAREPRLPVGEPSNQLDLF